MSDKLKLVFARDPSLVINCCGECPAHISEFDACKLQGEKIRHMRPTDSACSLVRAMQKVFNKCSEKYRMTP